MATVANVTGQCGNANGTAVPTAPDHNLCNAGTASAVSGSGPWAWNCIGTGGGNTAHCAANLCQTCSGTLTQSYQSEPFDGVLGSCHVTAKEMWTEVIEYSPLSQPSTIAWDDVMRHFTKTYAAVSVGTPYCDPCFMRTKKVNNARVQVTPKNACSNIQGTQTFNATNVTP
jgi:hypothetical protein